MGGKEDQKAAPCGVQRIPFVPSSPAPTRFLNQKQPLTSETGASRPAVWLDNCLFCLMPSVNTFHKYSGRQMLSFYCSLCVGCINNLKMYIEFHSVKFYFIPCIILCENIPMYMKCIINLFALQKMPCFNFIL